MPREWGRDPFYTLCRGTGNEGYGDVHTVMTKFNIRILKGIQIAASSGYFWYAWCEKNFALNKYSYLLMFKLMLMFATNFEGNLKKVLTYNCCIYTSKRWIETYGDKIIF
jgi:hypothetical protein